MATHSSILAWRIPMERGTWAGCSLWGDKELDMTEPLIYIYIQIYMESRKIILINLFAGQQWRCRYREQTYGHRGRERKWRVE